MKNSTKILTATLMAMLLAPAVAVQAQDLLQGNPKGITSKLPTKEKVLQKRITEVRPPVAARSKAYAKDAVFEVPYLEDFETEGTDSLFTIIDANGDGQSWERWTFGNTNSMMRVLYNMSIDMDDWLITPPIRFKAGRTYILKFKAHGTSFFNEKIEVKYGTENTVAGMTTSVVPVTTLSNDTTIEATFKATADGIGYVGFHGCSEKKKFYVSVDDIDIRQEALSTSPAEPTISVSPAAQGELKATISITAPTKAVDGSSLSIAKLSKLVLMRGEETLSTWEQVSPGQALSYEDTLPKDSTYTWTAVAYDGDEEGKKAAATAYVGVDTPKAPEHAEALDEDTKVKIAWDAIGEEGATGRYVNPAEVTTYIYNSDDYGYMEQTPSVAVTGATSAEIDFNTNEGEPLLKQWAVQNGNRAGKSDLVWVAMPVGKPIALPFVESVPEGVISNDWWMSRVGGMSSTNRWGYVTDDAADGDGGSFLYASSDNEVESYLNTYKLDVSEAVNPLLFFSYNVKESAETTKGKLSIEVLKPDNSVDTVFTSPEFKNDQPWKQEIVDLSAYAGMKWIVVKFHTYSISLPVTMGLDNIRIKDTYTDDLSAAISANSGVKKGQKINAVVTVTNIGENTASDFAVKIYADDAELQTIDINKSLKANEDTAIAVAIPTSTVLDADKTEKIVKAEVVYDVDLQHDNNEAVDTVALFIGSKGAPENLSANADTTAVELRWQEPSTASIAYTEDFETYTPFALDSEGNLMSDLGGGWTTIDGNPSAYVCGFFNNYAYPGQYKPSGFMIFNGDAIASGVYNSNKELHGHADSHQFACMPYEAVNGQFVDGNNYLVSPELNGEAQTISFFARNLKATTGDFPETFSVLASTAGNTLADLTTTVLADTTITGGEWQEMKVDVPEGTRYFAIHQTSLCSGTGNYLLSIDDATFKTAADKPVAYNIYCDGKLVGTVSADGDLSFNGTVPEGDHEWAVTAVYSDGEESQPVSIKTGTGIETLLISSGSVDVYSIDGKLVRRQAKCMNGLQAGVYIVNHKKVVIR